MKKKHNFSISILMILSLCSVLVGSCKKDDDFNNEIEVEIQTITDDRDGNVYNIIEIDDKVWMAENLKYLPYVIDPGRKSSTIPYCYVYDYNGTDVSKAKSSSNYRNYGVLYNWVAAQEACPDGWHLPSDEEWHNLIDYLGGEKVAGGKLRESSTEYWHSSYTNVTNETGFSALPGGFFQEGEFRSAGGYGYWWSSIEANANSAWFLSMSYNSSGVGWSSYENNKSGGVSVRCVQD